MAESNHSEGEHESPVLYRHPVSSSHVNLSTLIRQQKLKDTLRQVLHGYHSIFCFFNVFFPAPSLKPKATNETQKPKPHGVTCVTTLATKWPCSFCYIFCHVWLHQPGALATVSLRIKVDFTQYNPAVQRPPGNPYANIDLSRILAPMIVKASMFCTTFAYRKIAALLRAAHQRLEQSVCRT